MRSLATRQSNLALSKYVKQAVSILKVAAFDLLILETSGIGQSDTEIVDHSDVSLYVMTPEFGAPSQLEKIDMLDYADIIALNKFDKRGSQDALQAVKKQYQRNHRFFEQNLDEMPVYGTMASQFNDSGTNKFYNALIQKIDEKTKAGFISKQTDFVESSEKIQIIPPQRVRYLSEISEQVRHYNHWANEQSNVAQKVYNITQTIETLKEDECVNQNLIDELTKLKLSVEESLTIENKKIIENWQTKLKLYQDEYFVYKVREKEIKIATYTETL